MIKMIEIVFFQWKSNKYGKLNLFIFSVLSIIIEIIISIFLSFSLTYHRSDEDKNAKQGFKWLQGYKKDKVNSFSFYSSIIIFSLWTGKNHDSPTFKKIIEMKSKMMMKIIRLAFSRDDDKRWREMMKK